jgi:hypothetical protein
LSRVFLKMLIVTGGATASGERKSSTEVSNHSLGGSWHLAGELPSARSFLAGGSIDNVFYVTGGYQAAGERSEVLDEILAWEADTETWGLAGRSLGGRWGHALATVRYRDIEAHCTGALNK